MLRALKRLHNPMLLYCCAAVADFKPSDVVAQKIKREGNKLTLELTSTPDIAAALGA